MLHRNQQCPPGVFMPPGLEQEIGGSWGGYDFPQSPPGTFGPPNAHQLPMPATSFSKRKMKGPPGVMAPPGMMGPPGVMHEPHDPMGQLAAEIAMQKDMAVQQCLNDIAFYDSLLMPYHPYQSCGWPESMPMEQLASQHALNSGFNPGFNPGAPKKDRKSKNSKAPVAPTRSKAGGVEHSKILMHEVMKVESVLDYLSTNTPSTTSGMEGEGSANGSRRASEEDDEEKQQEDGNSADNMSADQMNVALAALDSTDEEQRQTVLQLASDTFWSLTLNKRGCRVVQKTIEVGTLDYQLELLQNMRGSVYDALQSPHGNYVLQKFIKVVPPEHVQFIVAELHEGALWVARHRFGCRVLQRLLERCEEGQIKDLIDKVVEDSGPLSKHAFGSFVLQQILQYGSPQQRSAISKVVLSDVMQLSKHRLGSHVVICALVHGSKEDVQALIDALLRDPDQFYQLSLRSYGSFVVKEVKRMTKLLQQSNKNTEECAPGNSDQ